MDMTAEEEEEEELMVISGKGLRMEMASGGDESQHPCGVEGVVVDVAEVDGKVAGRRAGGRCAECEKLKMLGRLSFADVRFGTFIVASPWL